VRMAVTSEPEVAGKPFRPLLDETVERLGAARPIFVGDRLDTDIAGARVSGMDSMLVLTGAHSSVELLAADATSRPTHLGYDLRALLAPIRRVRRDPDDSWSCDDQTATLAADRIEITTAVRTQADALNALWAAAHLSWHAADRGRRADATRVVETVSPVLRQARFD
jgi:glycerol-1-phosphatase